MEGIDDDCHGPNEAQRFHPLGSGWKAVPVSNFEFAGVKRQGDVLRPP